MKLKFKVLISALFLTGLASYEMIAAPYADTWANWRRKMDRAFDGLKTPRIPGRTMGIIVPGSTRPDLLPLTALGHEALDPYLENTVIILAQAPNSVSLNGLVMPDGESVTTSFGVFSLHTELRNALGTQDYPVYVDNSPFGEEGLPEIFENQLAALRFLSQGKINRLSFLPIYVNFEDLNYQGKDFAPFIVETIRSLDLEGLVSFIVAADLIETRDTETRILQNNAMLGAVRNLDLDALVEIQREAERGGEFTVPHADALGLGLLTFRWMGGDHGETLGYAHTGQLVLTKDRGRMISFVAAGVASEPPYPPRVKHAHREKIVKVFDELFRSDILTVARQAVNSMLDATAAKPPSLEQKEASKKWPLFVTIYDPEGNVAGEDGSHDETIPFEEALRRHAFEATQMARPKINKTNANNYVVEIGIPYGFQRVETANELIPILNGLVVETGGKSKGFHPNAWRTYPHPHQLLASICHQLGMKPWAYATKETDIQSFRTLSFNEKEPFQDLGKSKKKKDKKGGDEFDFDDGGGGYDGGAFTF